MARTVDFTGDVLDHRTYRVTHSNVPLDFFLVADEKSGFKYPLYLNTSRPSSYTREFAMILSIRKRVKVKGRFKLFVSGSSGFRSFMEASDMPIKSLLVGFYTKVVVPTNIGSVELRADEIQSIKSQLLEPPTQQGTDGSQPYPPPPPGVERPPVMDLPPQSTEPQLVPPLPPPITPPSSKPPEPEGRPKSSQWK